MPGSFEPQAISLSGKNLRQRDLQDDATDESNKNDLSFCGPSSLNESILIREHLGLR